MAEGTIGQAQPDMRTHEPIVALASPEVASPSGAEARGVGDTLLQDLLPEISAIARKVGGFKKLAEIAVELDRGCMSK